MRKYRKHRQETWILFVSIGNINNNDDNNNNNNNNNDNNNNNNNNNNDNNNNNNNSENGGKWKYYLTVKSLSALFKRIT